MCIIYDVFSVHFGYYSYNENVVIVYQNMYHNLGLYVVSLSCVILWHFCFVIIIHLLMFKIFLKLNNKLTVRNVLKI